MNTIKYSPLYFCTAMAFVVFACTTNGSKNLFEPTPDRDHLTVLLLQDVGPQVVSPNLDQFNNKLTELAISIENHTLIIQNSDEAIDLSDVQNKWKSAMLHWQQIELMQIGVLGRYYDVIGGEDKRSNIYSWPWTNKCRVDMVTVNRDYQMDDFFDTHLLSVIGLDALEYLFFGEMTSSCPEQVNINEDWEELSDLTIQQYRMEYALKLVEHIQVQTTELIDIWSIDGENYGLKLIDGSTYRSREAALNDILTSLFYLERFTLMYKLSDPLGLGCCLTDNYDCMLSAEHIPSNLSMKAIKHNLIGFEILFNNGNGYGFDDFFIDLGHSDLQQEMKFRIDRAKQSLEGQDLSLSQMYQESPDEVIRIHHEISSIVELLSSDVITVLNFKEPYIDCPGGD